MIDPRAMRPTTGSHPVAIGQHDDAPVASIQNNPSGISTFHPNVIRRS